MQKGGVGGELSPRRRERNIFLSWNLYRIQHGCFLIHYSRPYPSNIPEVDIRVSNLGMRRQAQSGFVASQMLHSKQVLKSGDRTMSA